MDALILGCTPEILSPFTLHLVRHSHEHFVIHKVNPFNITTVREAMSEVYVMETNK